MDVMDYYRAITKKAFLSTVDLKSIKKSAIRLFMFLFGLVLWRHFRGLLAAMDRLIETLLWVLVPGGFAFFGIFAWNLFLAPVRLRVSERKAFGKQIKKLERIITSLANELTELTDQTPNLIFQGKVILCNLPTPEGGTIKALVAYLNITNDSQVEFYATPWIRFGGVKAGNAFEIQGMWLDRPLPDLKSASGKPIEFPAGTQNKLAIAIRRGDAWYGMDCASPFVGYKQEKYKLTGTHITLKLKGNMPPITRHFELSDQNGPSLDEIKWDEITRNTVENYLRNTKNP